MKMRKEESTSGPNDVVININTGFPVKNSSGQATEFEKAYVTRPFRPHRRIHTYNRSPILSHITKNRPKPFRFRHDDPSPAVKVNRVPLEHDKVASRVNLQAKYARKFERPSTPIPTPPPMPPTYKKKDDVNQMFDQELVKAVIDPVEPWNKETDKEDANLKEDDKVELKEVSGENMVEKIFKEFENGVVSADTNDFINQITNSQTFQKFLSGTKDEMKNVYDEVKEISTGMFDQLFKQLTDVSDDEIPPLVDSEDNCSCCSSEDNIENSDIENSDIENSNIESSDIESSDIESCDINTCVINTANTTANEKPEFFDEMALDWKKFNEDIMNTTCNSAPVPMAANGFSSDFAQYKPQLTCGESLLQNDFDFGAANIYRSVENKRKKISNKISDKRIYVKELANNFEATNDQLITPSTIVEELIKVKNRVMSRRDSEDVNIELTTVCVNPNIVSKIRTQYYRQYPNETSDRSRISIWTNPSIFYNAVQKDFGMKRGRILSVLDNMIGKYRCLADDRKILDQATEIGDEIVDIVEEYKEVQTRLKKLNDFNEKIDQVRKNLVELSNMSMNLEEFEGFKEINNNLLNEVRCFQDGLSKNKVEELKNEAEQCQAKFNYYQKMSQTIVDRIKLIAEMPTSDFSQFNLESRESTPMKFDLYNVEHHKSDKPIFFDQFTETSGCKLHKYPFDLTIV